MKKLTKNDLVKSAKAFCEEESQKDLPELFGVTDGKKVGTIVEHHFQEYLSQRYDLELGSSANGLDLLSVNTDIKVTSIQKPQSSCPYRDSKQKVFGLGYNLIVFVYQKTDNSKKRTGRLSFVSCAFIDQSRTADFQTTTGLQKIIENHGNEEDVFAFLNDHMIPGDEVTLMNMAQEILENPPPVGYLTISNALQWRLQYRRIVNLHADVDGIERIISLSDGNT